MSGPFYSLGLRFSCTGCGACCRYEPGFVYLSKRDLTRLAGSLALTKREFVDRYCRVVESGGKKRLSLVEKPNYDCIFWENGGCSVYEARPFQCKSYPFWSNILRTREMWDIHKEGCPGMGSGTLYSQEEIDHWLALKDEEDYRYLPEEER